jgi:hypothetical protein
MPITVRYIDSSVDEQRPEVLFQPDEQDHEQRCDVGARQRTTTSKKKRIGPAPSMRAAPASLSGIVRKNW